MYGSWNMECNGQISSSFWTIFCPFTPLTSSEIKILNKMKKNAWIYYHFIQVYHKWQSYDVWFLIYQVQQTEFFVIWTTFCPLTSLTTQKIKILKKWKKHLEISLFYTNVPKIMIICYTVPEIWCRTDVYFRLFLCTFTPFFKK